MPRRYLSKVETQAYLANLRTAYIYVAGAVIFEAGLVVMGVSKVASGTGTRFYVLTALVVAAAPLFFWLVYHLQKWRLTHYEPAERPCRHCGYELKAACSDRCPECGHLIDADDYR